jgi:putative tricarboxylic transport membrane protein
MKRYNYPVAAMVLGVILSPIIDTNFRRGVAMEHGSVGSFFAGMFTNPISLVLIFIMFATVFIQSPYWDKLSDKLFKRNAA